jgi:hypothetical protein
MLALSNSALLTVPVHGHCRRYCTARHLCGCASILDSSGKPTISPFWPGGATGTDITAWVYDDPETLFDVQYTTPAHPELTPFRRLLAKNAIGLLPLRVVPPQQGIVHHGPIQATSGQFQITGFWI